MSPEGQLAELRELRQRLEESEETLRAIRSGEVDALVVDGPSGSQVYTLVGADHPYRAMIEAMQQGAASLSMDGTVLYCNRSLALMAGVPHDALIGSSVMDIFADPHRELLTDMLGSAHDRARQGELNIEIREDCELPVHVAMSPLELDNEKVICMIVTDLREQKRHQSLLETERRKDVFLATLSHEMRTPLNAILGWIRILRREGCTSEDMVEGLEVIERNTRAQAELIDDVLDMSRIVSSHISLHGQPCNLIEVIQTACQMVQPAADAKHIAMHLSLDESINPIWCDRERMQQVISNLLSNSVKYTRDEGNIWITLSRSDDALRIEVRDDGIGISKDFLPYVFDRFRQADDSTRRSFGGLGLGLSIVKQLVELHGGTVQALSDGFGYGATFTVEFPWACIAMPADAERATDPSAKDRAAADAPPLKSIRLLVVDDEPDARRVVGRLFEDAGAIVCTVGSVDEAMAAVRSFSPEVLISDIAMPRQDGHDLIRMIRQSGISDETLPAIALSAFAGPHHAQNALEAGFQHHFAKPADPDELIDLVRQLAHWST